MLTNTSNRGCVLRGYPDLIDIRGGTPGQRAGAIAVNVNHGGFYEYVDPGPVTIRVDPGTSISFAMGTGTGYEGPLVNLASARLQLPGGTLAIPVDLDVSGPAGHPVSVSVTAFASGTNGGN